MFKSKRMCKQFEKRHQNIETFIILCVLIEFLFMCCIYIPMYQYLPYVCMTFKKLGYLKFTIPWYIDLLAN